MGDRDYRALERQAGAEGSVQARAALLVARVRRGTLLREWLHVAAQLGDPAARAALGTFVPISTIDDLLAAVASWDLEACLRAAALLAGERSRGLERAGVPVSALLGAAEAWLAAPDAAARRDVIRDLPPGALVERRDLPRFEHDVMRLALEALQHALAGHHALARRSLQQALEAEHRVHPTQLAGPLRAALLPWALSERHAAPPPPALLREVPSAALRELAASPDAPRTAFRAALEADETKARATALRKALRAKRLERERVTLAAYLGDPAAWLVIKPAGEPAFAPPVSLVTLERKLAEHLDRFAKPLPKDELRRLRALRRHVDEDGHVRVEEPGPVWPEWSRDLMARLLLALGEEALERCEAETPGDPAPRAALEAARAFHVRPSPSAGAEVNALAKAARPRGASDARRAVTWAAELIVRNHEKARTARLRYPRQDVLTALEGAGLTPEALWDLLRETAIAWALQEDDLGLAARRYLATESFAEGEAIEHPKFGAGRVVKVQGKKIEVAFDEGVKTLVHAG